MKMLTMMKQPSAGGTGTRFPSQPLGREVAVSCRRWLGSGNVWGLNQAYEVAKRVCDYRHSDVPTDILNGGLYGRARLREMLDRGIDVRHPPVRNAATCARSYPLGVWIQPELEPANVEADIERLIEVGLHAERVSIPCPGSLQI